MIPTTLKKFQVGFRFLSLQKKGSINPDECKIIHHLVYIACQFSQTYQYYCNEITVCLMYRTL